MDKSPKSPTSRGCIVGETSNLSMDKRQENPESRSTHEASKISMEKCQEDTEDRSSCNEEKSVIPEAQGSPELRRKLSRTVAAREDARRLKTATLDRMGKMFKLKSNRDNGIPSLENTSEMADESSREDRQSTREKTNSLGRIFKLVDKNGEPRRLFNNSRSGSLSHMFRRKSTGAHEDANSIENSNSGVFSRIFNQWKNRSSSGNSKTEPNLCSTLPMKNKSLSSKPATNPELNLTSNCTLPSHSPPRPASPSSIVKSADIENPA